MFLYVDNKTTEKNRFRFYAYKSLIKTTKLSASPRCPKQAPPTHLPLVDDEQRGRVEAVGRLPLQHRLQAAQLVQDGLKEVPPQAPPVVQVLVEGLPEAFDRQAAAVVLVPAEVVAGAELVHLRGEGRWVLSQ